nr:hypothetical protein [Tanacetum cinerariifolium]
MTITSHKTGSNNEHFESVSVDVISNITPSDVKTVKTIDVNHKCVFSIEEPKPAMKNNFSPLIIEEWHSDDEMWNNTRRVNHKNFANKFTHPHPKRRFVPQAVLTRSGKINTAGASVTTAVRPVNTAGSKSAVNYPRLTETLGIDGLSTKLSDRVLDLQKTKTTQAKEIADLKKRVKKLERKRRSKTPGMNLFKIGTSRRRSLDYELAARLRAEEQRRNPLTKA